MIKKSLIYLLLSILVVLFAKYVHLAIVYIDMIYVYIMLQLASIFSINETGLLIRNVLVLALIPTLIAGIPALIYYVIKKQTMPYFMEIVWLLWLILVLSKVLIQ
jgi:hypothetical protein